VPCAIRWPGVIKPGTVLSNDIFSHHDMLPTLLAAAGEPDIVEKVKEGTKHCVNARLRIKIIAPLRWISVWGPGLLVMLADTDAGNVVTGAQAGARWGYRLLPLLLVPMPMLYMVQELTVRLGIYTAALVWFVPDLVWVNIAAQVLNAFLLPLVIGLLVALAVKALPEPLRLRGFYLWVLIGISAIVIAVGLFGGVSGLL
jgi:hypothetical protein